MSEVLDRLKVPLADRYTIERELGSGGMAVVFLAQDLRHERPVAIKVLRPELTSAVAAERFLQEIKITAGLAHPNILPLLDSGEADGLVYYVMPYVEGESLRLRLDRERQLPVDEALRITSEVADALSHAHEHKLLHRDIKPENILLEAGHAVVADFGIAKALNEAAGDRLTQTGVAVGTPAYMSPEQVAGDTEIDERSDIYSLACVVYEMLAGEAPHTGPNLRAILNQKMLSQPPSIRSHRPDLSASLDLVLRKALQVQPGRRFSTTNEFAQGLQAAGRPIHPGRRGDIKLMVAYAGLALLTYAAVSLAVGAFGLSEVTGPATVSLLAIGAILIVPVARWYELHVRSVLQIGSGVPRQNAHVPRALKPMFALVSLPLSRRAILIFSVGAAVLFSGLYSSLWTAWASRRTPPPVELGVSVLLFPFRATDSAQEFFGEGIAELLAVGLDGTPNVSVVDPSSVWRALRAERDSPARAPEQTEAIRLSREAGARSFVTGTAVRLGSRVDFAVRLYDTETGEALAAISLATHEDSLTVAINRLLIDLVSSLWGRGQTQSPPEIDRFATANAQALKAYLEAKSLARRGRFEEAEPLIEEAIELDSAFALAHLEHFTIRSNVLLLRGETVQGVREIINRAMRHRDRLTPRNRMRVEADMALDDTNGQRAAFLFERILSIDSMDVEAAEGLAYTLIRYGWQLQKNTDDIKAASDRAVKLDRLDALGLATHSLLVLLFEDRAALEEELGLLQGADTTSPYIRASIWSIRALLATPSQVESVLNMAGAEPASVVRLVASRLLTVRPALAERYCKVLLADSMAFTHQDVGLRAQVSLWLAEARLSAIDSLLREEKLGWLATGRATVAAALAGSGPPDLAARAVAEFEGFLPVDSIQAFIETKPYHVWAIAWAVAAYHAALGDTVEARAWQRAITDLPTGRSWFDWTGSLGADIEARLAVRRGDMETAEREARRAFELWEIHSPHVREVFPEPAIRFHLPGILAARGAEEQATWLYRSFIPPHGLPMVYTALASLQLGQIDEARGNREEAISHYLRAVHLWEHGDAEVIGRHLAQAQQGLVRLGHTE